MKRVFGEAGTVAEWNAAYVRLRDYSRALHIIGPAHRRRLIMSWLQAATLRRAEFPDRSPTELAMEEAVRAQNEWFKRILRGEDHIVVVGRVAMHLTDADTRWPGAFLTAEPPRELVQALRECEVHSVPDLRVSSMVPRPIDMSPVVGNILSEETDQAEPGPVLLALVALAVTIAVILLAMS
jgi:hypothetical protein